MNIHINESKIMYFCTISIKPIVFSVPIIAALGLLKKKERSTTKHNLSKYSTILPKSGKTIPWRNQTLCILNIGPESMVNSGDCIAKMYIR